MKAKLILVTLLTMLTFALTSQAEIPHVMNFQGKATDKSTGAPLNGTYTLTFRIYNHATQGTPAEALWTEIHESVEIRNGIFQVLLGASGSALNLPFDEDYWVSVEIDTSGELFPRTRIASGGYAYTAERAEHAITADTLTSQIAEIPSGVIVMWSGAIATIPEGWALCDGTSGTPDLRDRFIVGATQDDGAFAKTNVSGSLTQTGGEATHTLTVNEMPSHNHSYSVGQGEGGWNGGSGDGTVGSRSTNSTGGGQPHENCPPFYALAFIMKL